jgi:hypothetical protein
LSYLTARHAACKLRGKRRAGLRRARIRGRQTASVASVEFRPLSSRQHSATAPFAPKQRGPRDCGSAAGCAVPGFTARQNCLRRLRQTGSVPLAGLVTLRYRLRGASDRLGYRPARRVPALRWSFPPPIVGGFDKGLVLPTQPGSLVGN